MVFFLRNVGHYVTWLGCYLHRVKHFEEKTCIEIWPHLNQFLLHSPCSKYGIEKSIDSYFPRIFKAKTILEWSIVYISIALGFRKPSVGLTIFAEVFPPNFLTLSRTFGWMRGTAEINPLLRAEWKTGWGTCQ